ncbi:hypothetical protein GP486_006580 [Trichoglossum hirsutum]|uniref:Uncharacterized protein n=1 Tax=Trichoglossum hirsutum TaxID=265104 RepID=A0A9P8IH28_9PEZI|nr:hypothetical protein GP486_006580 [Trichoglossum hirsutum]
MVADVEKAHEIWWKDRRDDTESSASSPSSIWSSEDCQSIATNTTIGTSGAKQLVSLFAADEDLRFLILASLGKVEARVFEKTFSLSLKVYSTDLQRIATLPSHTAAAQMVGEKSKFVARLLRRIIKPEKIKHRSKIESLRKQGPAKRLMLDKFFSGLDQAQEGQSEVTLNCDKGNCDTGSDESEGDEIPNFESVKNFLVSTVPFIGLKGRLKDNLAQFLDSAKGHTGARPLGTPAQGNSKGKAPLRETDDPSPFLLQPVGLDTQGHDEEESIVAIQDINFGPSIRTEPPPRISSPDAIQPLHLPSPIVSPMVTERQIDSRDVPNPRSQESEYRSRPSPTIGPGQHSSSISEEAESTLCEATHPQELTTEITTSSSTEDGSTATHQLPDERTSLLGSEFEEVLWSCSCGVSFTEHIQECVPGGVSQWLQEIYEATGTDSRVRFAADLRRSTIIGRLSQFFGRTLAACEEDGASPASRARPDNHLSSESSDSRTIRSSGASSSSVLERSGISTSSGSPGGGTGQTGQISSASPSDSGAYLLLCFNYWGFKTKLIHLDISGCRSDMAMFQKMNEKYYGVGKRRRLWNLLSLRTLSSIEFVRFHIYFKNNVAIDLSTIGELPPASEPYVYSVGKRAIKPNIPNQALLHFFLQPEHSGGCTHSHRRLPKRTAKLELAAEDCYAPGWGPWFREEFSWAKAFVMEALIAGGSLAFGIAWSLHSGNGLQDGFSVGAWMLTVGTLGLGLLHGVSNYSSYVGTL